MYHLLRTSSIHSFWVSNMPRDKVDPFLITNEPCKHKLASYVTNKDNISADKEEMVKIMKCTTGFDSHKQPLAYSYQLE